MLFNIITILAIGLVPFLFIMWLILIHDKRWYAKHPGVEKELARIDRELDKQGL